MTADVRFRLDLRTALIPAAATAFALAGAALAVASPGRGWGQRTWLIGLVATGVPVLWRTLRSMMRGHFATDIVAMLAIAAAIALREPLAGLIVVVMQTGGEALERYAEGRASRAVRALEEQAPRIAHRIEGDHVVDLPVDAVGVGDELLVRPGEMVPCDGVVVRGRSIADPSRLTGEPTPVEVTAGVSLMSGTLNGAGSFVLRATAPSRESQYARIVELVRSAEASKAPLQRLADRYAVWFTPVTLLVCLVTWLVSGDATRVLAVLVVATPCPLILATPIAIIGGVNRAAARQIIMRTGGALEQLDEVTIAVLDKTGTLTVGEPRVSKVTAVPPHDEREVLRLAAALEQHSGHLLARPVVEAAKAVNGALPAPRAVQEAAGRGVSGEVEGRRVTVGSRGYVLDALQLPSLPPPFDDGATALRAYVTVDDRLAGVVEYADSLRPGAAELLRTMHRLGIRRTVLLSGDHTPNVRAVAEAIGVDEAVGDLLPGEKVARVADLSRAGRVLMVGDGTNDAPALAQADVGVALAGHGGGITAEAADVVVLIDDLARVGEAIAIGQRTMRIARESIWVGLSLSGIAMLFAAAGYIPPVVGALLQEGIDVAVILNALRASAPGRVVA